MARVSERSQLFYRAEHAALRMVDLAGQGDRSVRMLGSTFTLPEELRFGDVAGMQRYVDRLLGLNWVRARWPERSAAPITVAEQIRVDAEVYYRASGRLLIPLKPAHDRDAVARPRELTVLHGVAHHLSEDGGHRNGDGEFIPVYLELIGELIGPEMRLFVETTLRDHEIAL